MLLLQNYSILNLLRRPGKYERQTDPRWKNPKDLMTNVTYICMSLNRNYAACNPQKRGCAYCLKRRNFYHNIIIKSKLLHDMQRVKQYFPYNFLYIFMCATAMSVKLIT